MSALAELLAGLVSGIPEMLLSIPPVEARPPLRLRNTLSGELEAFEPRGKAVTLYNCGPTAYDVQHVGNLFPPTVANVLHRTLEAWGYRVKEVNNITDFGHLSEDEASEDKMSKGLRAAGLPLTLANMRTVAEKYAALFFNDLPKIGIDPKKVVYPRASDYIAEQIALIQKLEHKGFAYQTTEGVYFDTAKVAHYGKLGGLSAEGQLSGVRVGTQGKRNPQDFVLWKPDAKIGWHSPWGLGFPGWHSECVAMIFKLLGEEIDIHMGGMDLIPIHHNNEVAQAEAASGKEPFVSYWVHNAFITIEGKKISKSLGNVVYLDQIIERGLSPMALRYWFLTGHYRTPMNFTWEALEGANTALQRLRRATAAAQPQRDADKDGGSEDEQQRFLEAFYAAIANDLDTPRAIALIWENIKILNKDTLGDVDTILGLGLTDQKEEVVPEAIQKLAQEREEARQNKDFARSDQLRAQIEAAGFEVKDMGSGSQITKK